MVNRTSECDPRHLKLHRCTSIHDFFQFLLLQTVMRTDAANSEKRDGNAAIRARHRARERSMRQRLPAFAIDRACDSEYGGMRISHRGLARAEICGPLSSMVMRRSHRGHKAYARPAEGTTHVHTHACASRSCASCFVLTTAAAGPQPPHATCCT